MRRFLFDTVVLAALALFIASSGSAAPAISIPTKSVAAGTGVVVTNYTTSTHTLVAAGPAQYPWAITYTPAKVGNTILFDFQAGLNGGTAALFVCWQFTTSTGDWNTGPFAYTTCNTFGGAGNECGMALTFSFVASTTPITLYMLYEAGVSVNFINPNVRLVELQQ